MSYADFDDDFEQAEVPDNEEAPCGTYQCEITRFFNNTTQTGIDRLNCVLQVIAGEHIGKILYKGWLITPSALSYLKADFKKFGLPVASKKFSELMPMLDTNVIGKRCEAVKKQSDRYANVYINSMLDPLSESKQTCQAKGIRKRKTAATKNDDDVPF